MGDVMRTIKVMTARSWDTEQLGTIVLTDDGDVEVRGKSVVRLVEALPVPSADRSKLLTPEDGEEWLEQALPRMQQEPYLWTEEEGA